MTDPRRCPACGYPVAVGLQICPKCQGVMPLDQPASVLISFVPGMKTGGLGAPSSPSLPSAVTPSPNEVQEDLTPVIGYPPPPGPSWNGPFSAGVPVVPSGQGISAVTAPKAVDLVFDTGQSLRVSGPGLLGRNPQSADPTVTCANVQDLDMSVSKTHLEVGIDEQGFWVKDRGSTNGSALIDESGQAHRLEAGVIVHLKIGGIVAIGHRRFRVEDVK